MNEEQIAANVGPAGIDVAYQRFGAPEDPVVLLVMGVGGQLVAWPEAFCDELVKRRLQVVRFDNRDVGRSSHMTRAPVPNLPAVLAGDHASVSYTLSDMAADTVGLLDALGVKQAHLVGASMGGAIAQTIAIEHPSRVRSLTSIMATTGNMAVGQPAPEVLQALFSAPPAVTRDEVIGQMMKAFRLVGSPAYPTPDEEIVDRAGRAYDRSYDPLGVARQAVATVASGDRTAKLRELRVPTLVIHGAEDRMCDPSGGRATAEAIPGAELLVIEGMGHDLPPALRVDLAERIADHVHHAEKR